MGYSPWGLKESDTTERLSTQHNLPRNSHVYSKFELAVSHLSHIE